MLNSADIQLAYNKLYIQLRKYFWDFQTVELIAQLEVECYQSFPTIFKIRNIYSKLSQRIRSTTAEDEEFTKACKAFSRLITDNDTIYRQLDKVMEVLPDDYQK